MKVSQYINDVIAREGGFVDHPHDKGGPTCWGITENVARAFGYRGPMQLLSKDTAFDIYLARYWEQPRLNDVNAISPRIAEELFDTGVNMGAGTAGKFLQRALNVLNKQGSLFTDVVVDGAIGAMTLHALKTYLDARKEEGEEVLLKMLNAQQSVRYLEIAEADSRQESFQHGWQVHRVEI